MRFIPQKGRTILCSEIHRDELVLPSARRRTQSQRLSHVYANCERGYSPGSKGATLNSGGDKAGEVDMAHQILAYLHANPDAQDTLEGIIEWWLLDQNIKRQSEAVKQALVQLTARGLVVARMGTDSRVHYGIDRSKRDEIESLLKHSPQAS